MKLSTKTRYGMRFMVDLAQHWDAGAVALKDIAKRQDISKKYLEQIVALLSAHDLVKATRGFSGGYRLARDPASITAADVFIATEGSLTYIDCTLDPQGCKRHKGCPTQPLWAGFAKIAQNYLEGITLKDLAEHSLG